MPGQNNVSTKSAPAPLPPIDQCLFGHSAKSPQITADIPKPSTVEGQRPTLRDSTQYDSLYLGHWGDAATQHDIDLAKLRRICSQGIVDEGSHRGVAWRVLLGYLPTNDIHKTWPETIPPQRELYISLVTQYMEGPLDNGLELSSQLCKTMAKNSIVRQNMNTLKRLDETDESNDGSIDGEEDEPENSNGNNTKVSDLATTGYAPSCKSLPPPTLEKANIKNPGKIEDRLPAQYREHWRRSGIALDNKSVRDIHGNQATALGINILSIPELNNQEEFEVFLEDAKLLEEIRKDVVRTHPDLRFFLEPTDNLGLRRYAAIERILFVWSKLNKGVRYVQGMNEIVGTLYFVLANDFNLEWAAHAEADSYFLFHTLMMGDMRDVFCPDMDSSVTGIQGRIDNVTSLLKTHDPEIQEHLVECGIDASFYAIRWLTTLLSREVLLPDTIRLWDSMFASSHKENFLRYVCGTMVMLIRDDLLKGDFSACLRLLQSYPPSNIDTLLESSRSLWIYESQITLACHKGGISLHQALQTVAPPASIIMAFGLRGGIAPGYAPKLKDTVEQVSENLEHAGHGLLGRAKELWSGWGKETVAAPASAPAPAEAPTPLTSLPPRPRFWNRGRNDSSGSKDESTKSEGENYSSGDGGSGSFSGGVSRSLPDGRSDSLGLATLKEGLAENIPSPAARSRLWNRSEEKKEPLQFDGRSSITETDKRRPIWNRGTAEKSTSDVHQDLIS